MAKTTTTKKAAEERRKQPRRSGNERRQKIDTEYKGEERREGERREEKTERRRQIDPTTCERDYTPDEIEFMSAIDEYKRRSRRQFPTCSEYLEVLIALGYRKVAERGEMYSPEPAASTED